MKERLIHVVIFLLISVFLLSSCRKLSLIEVTMKVSVEENNGQIRVKGSTNLPNGMLLTLLLQRESEGYEFKSEETITVKDGSFTSDWISDEKRPYNKLKPGEYSIQIFSKIPSKQPASVKNIIGEKGEYLQSQLVMDEGKNGKIIIYNLKTEIRGEDLSKPKYIEEGKEIKFTLEQISKGLEKNGFSLRNENIDGNEATVAQDSKGFVRVEMIGDSNDIGIINVMTEDIASDEVKNCFKDILDILFPEWVDSESWIKGYFNEELAKSDDKISVGKTINYGNKYITIDGIKSDSKVRMSIGSNK